MRNSETQSLIPLHFIIIIIIFKKATVLLDHKAAGQKEKILIELRFANNQFMLWELIF